MSKLNKMKRKIFPPTYFIILLLLCPGLHFIFPVIKVVYPPYTYIGVLLILIGFVIVLSAVRMIESEVKKGKKPDKMLWVLFSGIALFSVVSIGTGIYFIVVLNQ